MSGSELTSLGEEPLHTESVRLSSPSDFSDGKDSKQANKSSEVKPKQQRMQPWFVFLFLELVTSDENKSNLYSCIYPFRKQKKRSSASKQSSKPAGSAFVILSSVCLHDIHRLTDCYFVSILFLPFLILIPSPCLSNLCPGSRHYCSLIINMSTLILLTLK